MCLLFYAFYAIVIAMNKPQSGKASRRNRPIENQEYTKKEKFVYGMYVLGGFALWGTLLVGLPVGAGVGIKHLGDEHAREELAKRTAIEQSFDTGIKLSPVELSDEKNAGEALIDDGAVKVVDKFIVEGEEYSTIEPFITGLPNMPVLPLAGSETEKNYFLTLKQKQENSAFADPEGYVTYSQEVPVTTYYNVDINDILQYESLVK